MFTLNSSICISLKDVRNKSSDSTNFCNVRPFYYNFYIFFSFNRCSDCHLIIFNLSGTINSPLYFIRKIRIVNLHHRFSNTNSLRYINLLFVAYLHLYWFRFIY